MTPNTFSLKALAASVCLGLGISGTTATFPQPAAAEEVIRVLTFASADAHDLGFVIFKRYMKWVNEAGEGEVRMERIGGPEVVPLRDQVKAVSRGIADWVMTFTIHSAQVPEIDTVGLSQTTPQEERKRGFIDLLDEAHKKIGLKVIGRTATDGGFFIFSKRPITDISQFKGLRIRSHSGYDDFFNALGATPVHMAISEIYPGLERGVVDAAPYPLYVSHLGLHEVVCCALADDFWPAHTTFSFINRQKWDGLSPEIQKLLTDTQLRLEDEMAAMAAKLKEAEISLLKSKGVQFHSLPADQAKVFLQTSLDARWASIKERLPADQFNRIRAMLSP